MAQPGWSSFCHIFHPMARGLAPAGRRAGPTGQPDRFSLASRGPGPFQAPRGAGRPYVGFGTRGDTRGPWRAPDRGASWPRLARLPAVAIRAFRAGWRDPETEDTSSLRAGVRPGDADARNPFRRPGVAVRCAGRRAPPPRRASVFVASAKNGGELSMAAVHRASGGASRVPRGRPEALPTWSVQI